MLIGSKVPEINGDPQPSRFERFEDLQGVRPIGLSVPIAYESVINNWLAMHRQWAGHGSVRRDPISAPGDQRAQSGDKKRNREKPAPPGPETTRGDRGRRPDAFSRASGIEQKV